MIQSLAKATILCCAMLYTTAAYSQDPCTRPPGKKAQKLLDEASAPGRMSEGDRLALINQSLQADPECMPCLYAKARLQYAMAFDRGGNAEPALGSFRQITQQCPLYHADAWYYLGLIAYTTQEYEIAAEALEQFLLFDPAKGKTSKDHSTKRSDAQRMLPETKFYHEFYANPVPFDPVPVPGVNSAADEYLPMLSPDNEYLYFTRKKMEKAKGDLYEREVETFMQSFREMGEESFGNPEPLPPPFNTGDNYGGVSISLNNREMYITVCKPTSPSYKNCDLYVTRYERITGKDGLPVFNWSGLENLGPAINTPDGWEAQPSISADGNLLFFATIRATTTPNESGNPTMDLYYSRRKADGTWEQAKPVEGPINSKGHDKSPFLHTDSRTLYFSSNGRPGAGGFDIYYSRQAVDGTWSEPKNIGYPINTAQDEHGLIVSTDGKRAYFASAGKDRSKGLDLFSFELPQKARPEKILLLKGEVSGGDSPPPPDTRIEVKYSETDRREFEVNKDDGTYAAVVNLQPDKEVLVRVKSSEPIAFNARVFTMADTLVAVQQMEMKTEPIKPGMTYRIDDIRFATNSSDLNPESMQVLDEFAAYLLENPSLKIEIGGHTDNVGDPHKNLVLSTDRAFEVFGYLQQSGIDFNRMTFKGYGDKVPLLPNTTPANRAKNRRTEFKVIAGK